MIFTSLLVTILLWIFNKALIGGWYAPGDEYRYIAKPSALLSVVLFAWIFLLSTRWKTLEEWFGGFDQQNHIHQTLAKWLLPLLLLHPLANIIGENRWDWLYMWNFDSVRSGAITLGVMSVTLLVIMIGVSILRISSFRFFKKVHLLNSVIWVLIVFHILLLERDLVTHHFLTLWVYGWIGIGTAGMLSSLFYARLTRSYDYTVETIRKFHGVWEVWLQPRNEGDRMLFEPGQWVYISFFDKHGVLQERHPFSIASAPSNARGMKLGIKEIGLFSRALSTVTVGDNVRVWGPYGVISVPLLEQRRPLIAIGGGIGVTPLLGIWKEAIAGCNRKSGSVYKPVHLIYCINNNNEDAFDTDIQSTLKKAEQNGDKPLSYGHTYERYLSSEKGYITVDYLQEKFGDLQSFYFCICGPAAMTASLTKQLQQRGVPIDHITVERFQLLKK